MPDHATPPHGAEVYVALLTPFATTGAPDLDALRAHIDRLVDAGVDGLVTTGTTGEGALLSDDELIAVTAAAVAAGAGRLSVVAHVGRPGTQATIELGRRAVAAGADTLLAVTPYFYGLSQEQLARHFEDLVAADLGRPLLAYVIPVRAVNDLEPATAARLAAAGLAGVKDSSKDMSRHHEYLALKRDGFDVYMGSDATARESLQAGSSGLMSALANIWPEQFVALRDAVAAGSDDEAEALQREITAHRDEIGRSNTIARLKQALAERSAEAGLVYPSATRRPLG